MRSSVIWAIADGWASEWNPFWSVKVSNVTILSCSRLGENLTAPVLYLLITKVNAKKSCLELRSLLNRPERWRNWKLTNSNWDNRRLNNRTARWRCADSKFSGKPVRKHAVIYAAHIYYLTRSSVLCKQYCSILLAMGFLLLYIDCIYSDVSYESFIQQILLLVLLLVPLTSFIILMDPFYIYLTVCCFIRWLARVGGHWPTTAWSFVGARLSLMNRMTQLTQRIWHGQLCWGL
jgi:hypothetical protein